jgi:hypothetical protein
MIKFLRKLLGLCDHSWEILKQHSLYKYGSVGKDLPIGDIYIQQCTKCGVLKKSTFRT